MHASGARQRDSLRINRYASIRRDNRLAIVQSRVAVSRNLYVKINLRSDRRNNE